MQYSTRAESFGQWLVSGLRLDMAASKAKLDQLRTNGALALGCEPAGVDSEDSFIQHRRSVPKRKNRRTAFEKQTAGCSETA